MKQQFRKVIIRFAALVVLLGVLILPGKADPAYAEGTDAGGTRAEAMEIQVNQTYSETSSSNSDEDYFKFTTTERGYFQVTLAQNDADDTNVGQGWKINIMDEDGETLITGSGITTSWSSIAIPYTKGTTFYVQVMSYNGVYGAVKCVYDLTVTQTATEEWEEELNDTLAQATVIKADQTYHGNLINQDDTDYFKFTTTVHGYFQVQFAHNAADNYSTGHGWSIYVLDDEGNMITSGSAITKNWTSLTLPYAEAGRTFYVQVMSYNGGYGAKYCTYDLTVNQTAASDWELEPNGTRAAATPIHINQTYHGITGGSGDTDVYRFQTTSLGYFRIQFAHNMVYSNNTDPRWEIRVLNEAGEQILRYYDVRTSLTSLVFPYAQAGKTFYVQVERYSGTAFGAYDLTILQTAASDWEAEPNGTMTAATQITMGKTYNGITIGSQDQDYYKVSVTAAGNLNIKLKPSLSNSPGSVSSGWNIVVYDQKSNEVAKLQRVATENSVSLDVKKGIYYIKIVPYSILSAPANCQYSISTSHVKAPSKPKISSVKAAKKAATVKWKKVSGASGYYIYRSTSKKGEYTKVKTIKKASTVSWKNKKLTSRQKYYYKVVAYKKSGGVVAVSSYSSAKSVKVK